ncbi:MAG: NAD(P)-dependent oxidoreductase [Methanomicrobiales archaeon]|nr:NAD(P)-dependent oxidoreductase [Methanomicrobiales archaeon]MDD1671262.1 NAD(P)-dependent oxidoreductase [Methanomicrobiales archaeon]
MKALVTGGKGFLGHHILRELLKKGISVVSYDISEQDLPLEEKDREAELRVVHGDILDPDSLEEAMEGCDLVFHTAAIADMDEARKMPVRTMEVNTVGTAYCLEAARKAGVRRFLFASSVYTSGNKGSFYRVSKQAGESLCKTYAGEFGLPYTILKYGSLYGREPNQWNFISGVCKSLLLTGEFTYMSSPDAEREYIHICDAARETVNAALSPDFINRTVLITGHQRIKIRELFALIQEILGKEVRINYLPLREGTHYIMTPYSFEADIPVRITLKSYVDISEGILDCLHEVKKELDKETGPSPGS